MSEQLEDLITERVKFLYVQGVYQRPLEECIRQAISEYAKSEDLRDIYSQFDITINEYIESIANKIKEGEL